MTPAANATLQTVYRSTLLCKELLMQSLLQGQCIAFPAPTCADSCQDAGCKHRAADSNARDATVRQAVVAVSRTGG